MDDWSSLFKETFGVTCSERAFRSNFGVSPSVCNQVWEVLSTSNIPFQRVHLFWTLSFLKTYSKYDVLRTHFGASEKTIRFWLWKVIDELYKHFDEVFFIFIFLLFYSYIYILHLIYFNSFFFLKKKIHMEDRFNQNEFENTNLAVDVTVCPIQKPKNSKKQRRFYSGKHKCHVVKWEVGVRISDGKVCWFSYPFQGRRHDLYVFRNSGIKDELEENEKVLTDKAYVGEATAITPYKKVAGGLSDEQLLHNGQVNKSRVIVERVFGRLKDFTCLKVAWRHSLAKQNKCFVLCLHITNLQMKENPL